MQYYVFITKRKEYPNKIFRLKWTNEKTTLLGKKYDLFEHQMLYINKWATKTHMTLCREKMTNKTTYDLKDKTNESQLTFLHRPILHQPNWMWMNGSRFSYKMQGLLWMCFKDILLLSIKFKDQLKTNTYKMNFYTLI